MVRILWQLKRREGMKKMVTVTNAFPNPIGQSQDLRTGGCWSDPRLGQYSFRGLMIVI